MKLYHTNDLGYQGFKFMDRTCLKRQIEIRIFIVNKRLIFYLIMNFDKKRCLETVKGYEIVSKYHLCKILIWLMKCIDNFVQ